MRGRIIILKIFFNVWLFNDKYIGNFNDIYLGRRRRIWVDRVGEGVY